MHLLNLTLAQFLAVFGSVSAVMLALYLLDRSRRRQIVSTLRFWMSAEQPTVVARRRRIQQPFSLLLQLASIALLLLAIAQLRLGAPASLPRDHVLILDTSAWMAARTSTRTLMDAARDRALAYIRAVPARDRIMLVRADALATPATAFEPDRQKLEAAVAESQPGATALNLDQALAFARQIQVQNGRRAGEVAFVGTGKIAEREPGTLGLRNLRFLSVPDALENCGLRRIGVRRSSADPDVWEIYVSLRNYGAAPHTLSLALTFGPSIDGPGTLPAGSQRITLPPGADREASFQFRSRAGGFLQAATSAARCLPCRRSRHPATARPTRAARDRLFRRARPAAPRTGGQSAGGGHLSRAFRIQRARTPHRSSSWTASIPRRLRRRIPSGSIRRRAVLPCRCARACRMRPSLTGSPTIPWGPACAPRICASESASVFEAAPDDLKIAEVAEGPVIVARPGNPKIVVFGFHPAPLADALSIRHAAGLCQYPALDGARDLSPLGVDGRQRRRCEGSAGRRCAPRRRTRAA